MAHLFWKKQWKTVINMRRITHYIDKREFYKNREEWVLMTKVKVFKKIVQNFEKKKNHLGGK